MLWAKQSKSLGGWSGFSLTKDASNNLYLSGGGYWGGHNTSASIIFGGDTLSITNAPDPSVVYKLDTVGHVLCSSIISDGGDDNNTISCSSSGEFVYLGGDIITSIIFGKDTLTGSGEFPFIARWNPCINSLDGLSPIMLQTNNITIFPNPNNGVFQLKIGHAELVSASQPILEVYNILGERVLNETLKQVQGDNTINLSTQLSGIYLYRVLKESGEPIGQGKIIIQK